MRNINKNKDRKILKVILELYQTFSLKNQKLTKLVLLVIGINAIVSTLTVISAAPFISIISNPEIITNNKFVQEFIINPFDLNNREVVFIFCLFLEHLSLFLFIKLSFVSFSHILLILSTLFSVCVFYYYIIQREIHGKRF